MSAVAAFAQTSVANNRRGLRNSQRDVDSASGAGDHPRGCSHCSSTSLHTVKTSRQLLVAYFALVLAGYAGYAVANARLALLAAVVGTALAIALGAPVASLAVFPWWSRG